MPQRLRVWGLAAGLLLGVALSVALPTWAGRNSSGTYALPAGNPVIPGTPISSTWANTTLADIANGLTESLDRQGRGAMAAPLQLSTGTAATPSLIFSGDTNTGLYHHSADSPAMVTGGGVVQTWTLTGTSVSGVLAVSGSAIVGGAALASADTPGLTLRNSANQSRTFWEDGRGTVGNRVGRLIYDSGADLGVPGWQFQIANDSGGFVAAGLTVHRAGGISIGATGTPISASYGATYNIDFPLVNSGECGFSLQTLTGAVVGGVCMASVNNSLLVGTPGAVTDCAIVGANQVRVRVCNFSGAGTNADPSDFYVRVFQP